MAHITLSQNVVVKVDGKRKVYAAGERVDRAVVADVLKLDPKLDADHESNVRSRSKIEELQAKIADANRAAITKMDALEAEVGKPKKGRN